MVTRIAAGIKTDILIIAAPSEAAAGETIEVTVIIKNIDIYNHVVACVANYDSERFIDLAAIIYSGETYAFIGTFVMPNKAVTVSVWSYYPYYSEWIADDSAQKNIALSTVPVGWALLDTVSVAVAGIEVPVGWALLDTASIIITPEVAITEWKLLASATVNVVISAVVPPPPPPPPEKEAIPSWLIWGGVIGGAAALAYATTKPKKKAPVKKAVKTK